MAEGVIYDVFVETLLNDDAFNEFTDIYIKPEVSTSHGQHNRSDHLIPTELNEGLIRINRLIITPTKEYFIGPEVEVSNRVTRKFKDVLDNFLRVQFTDEDMSALSARTLETSPETFLKTQIRSERTDIYHRIHDVLKHGIRLDGKNYEFLAFSSSQLRSHSLWMFASDQNLNSTCDSIRSWMGNFANIRNVAKCAARMGQCFSSSKQGPVICHYEIEEIPDIERMNAGVNYCFSDGIGRISPAFALDVARTCACFKGKRHNALTPSAFQIRYGGYKGVVAIYPSSISKVTFRPSMKKFQSELNVLDVLEWTRFLPCYLNRQIITLLSTLGLSDDVFISMQKERFISLDGVLKNREAAVKLLQVSCGGEHHKMMMQMLFAGYDPGEEPFLLSMLQAFKSAQIQQILKKSKIFVPKGRILMGCLDEYACLNYGEVFVKVSSSEGSPVHVIKGTVIVTKNPCLHPGDIRILQAVDSPDLQHMIDCVVFPQKGARPHPNECSGSDLDGDLYFVSWDERLIPPVMEPPMDYYPPNSIALDHFPTLEEIQDYFMEYMSNDSLGTIANAHVVFADKEPEKARSQPCIELAELSSIAVDFPKTGVSAMLPKHLRPKAYPDFMEKSGKRSYISTGILGKLYRAAKEDIAGITTSAHLKLYHEYYDPQLVLDGYEDHVEKALQYRRVYDEKLTAMMQFYGVQSEAEMLTGCFSELRPTFGNSIKDVEEKILHAFSGLVVDAKSWFKEMHVAAGQNKDYVIASAWYHVTYHRDFLKQEQGPELGKTWLVSFAWLNYDKLLEIKKYRRLDKSLSAMESLK
ncbi:hypothetical protein KP509_19G025000 [Ceratopteris richardii]|nr:hypothetical protein KP509_19G025000 [Ceratopteris richardii]